MRPGSPRGWGSCCCAARGLLCARTGQWHKGDTWVAPASLPGSRVTQGRCFTAPHRRVSSRGFLSIAVGHGMVQAESCCFLLPPAGGEEEVGGFPHGNSQLLCLQGLEPPTGAQHPAWGTSCIPGVSRLGLMCLASDWEQLWVLPVGTGRSAGEHWGTRCPQPAPAPVPAGRSSGTRGKESAAALMIWLW